jgi:hypothetical protein
LILITTAGNVGSEAARLLVVCLVPVRVLVRDPGKAKALADAGPRSRWATWKCRRINEAMKSVSAVVLVSAAVDKSEVEESSLR